MHAEISNADAPLVDPRPVMVLANPATWYRQDLRFALKCWNQNLLRADLTPSQRSLAWLIGQDTLARGFYFCIYDALEDLVCEARGVEPVFGISRGNLTEAMCGFSTSEERKASARRAAGLEGLGLVSAHWMHLEGRMRWALTVLPDATQWSCGLVPLARLRSRAMVLDGQLKSFAPHLAGEGFAPEPTLKDALAATSFEASSNALSVARADQRPFGHRRADASLTKADAPAATVFAGRRANAARGSESRNADSPIKTRCVPKVGTSCARASENGKQRTETVQPLNCSGNANRTNRLIADLKAEFVRAHGEAQAAAEMQRSGIFWRKVSNNFPNELDREIGALRGFILEGGKFERAAWFWLQFYLLQTIGESSWEAAWQSVKKIGNPTF